MDDLPQAHLDFRILRLRERLFELGQDRVAQLVSLSVAPSRTSGESSPSFAISPVTSAFCSSVSLRFGLSFLANRRGGERYNARRRTKCRQVPHHRGISKKALN